MKRTESIFKQLERYEKFVKRIDDRCTKMHTKRWSPKCGRCRVASSRLFKALGFPGTWAGYVKLKYEQQTRT